MIEGTNRGINMHIWQIPCRFPNSPNTCSFGKVASVCCHEVWMCQCAPDPHVRLAHSDCRLGTSPASRDPLKPVSSLKGLWSPRWHCSHSQVRMETGFAQPHVTRVLSGATTFVFLRNHFLSSTLKRNQSSFQWQMEWNGFIDLCILVSVK